jgi:hypothetical protein
MLSLNISASVVYSISFDGGFVKINLPVKTIGFPCAFFYDRTMATAAITPR